MFNTKLYKKGGFWDISDSKYCDGYGRYEINPIKFDKSADQVRFEEKINRFGWNIPTEQYSATPKVVNQSNLSELSIENKILLSFLDRYFDLLCIDSELYALNLNKLTDEQVVSLNARLRTLLEHKGLYDFEINSYIINGSDATRMHIADGVG